jgi:hypothetical protein
MSRKVLTGVLIVFVFLFVGPALFSQRAYQNKIDAAGTKLTRIETLVSKVETQKLISLALLEEVENTTRELAADMREAFAAAVADAKSFAETKGQSGTIVSLQELENKTGPKLQTRVKAVESKTKVIDGKIPTGEILFDRTILQSMSSSELVAFTNSLAPTGVQKYRAQFPDLFKNEPEPAPWNEEGRGPAEGVEESCPPFEATLTGTADSSEPAASGAGAAALGCVAPCVAQNWTTCISCLIGVGLKGEQMANEFDNCWENCADKSTKWKRFWCRFGCAAKLIAQIL